MTEIASDSKAATPDVETISATDAQRIIGELVSRAQYGGQRTVILRRGEPAAAIVSIADLEVLQRMRPAA